jgi:uncharacterized protein YndB with AHSA1/START domain
MITENSVSSDEVIIEAPAELVWDILLDFSNYENWNTFCPSAKNDSLEMGSPVDMMVELGGHLSQQVEYICRVEPGYCIAWAMENKPEDPVHAVRTQYVKRLDDRRCTYLSIDEFGGPEMTAMIEQFGPLVETGFNQCARDLKAHAEKTHGAG